MAEKTGCNPRTVFLVKCVALVVSLCCLTLPSRGGAQDAEVGEPVQPAPEIRLTGVLAAVQEPASSAFPDLSLWIDGTRWHLQVRKVEALIPAYPAEQELQKVSGLGLRVLADPKVLSVLQSPELHDRPIVLIGQLGVTTGVLRVHSAGSIS
jgi:hypothetical protein